MFDYFAWNVPQLEKHRRKPTIRSVGMKGILRNVHAGQCCDVCFLSSHKENLPRAWRLRTLLKQSAWTDRMV